jgi:hypothetical protein
MNRSVCSVMMGVAGLAVLGMTATLVGAQTDGADVRFTRRGRSAKL